MRLSVMIQNQACLAICQRMVRRCHPDGEEVVMDLAHSLLHPMLRCNAERELEPLACPRIAAAVEAEHPQAHHRSGLGVPISFARGGGMRYLEPAPRLVRESVGAMVPRREPREPGGV